MNSSTDFVDERGLNKAPKVSVRYTEKALAEDGSNAAFAKGCTLVYNYLNVGLDGPVITQLHELGVKTVFVCALMHHRANFDHCDTDTAKNLGVRLGLAPDYPAAGSHLLKAVDNEATHAAFRWLSGKDTLPEPMASNDLMLRAVAHVASELQAKRIDANTLKDIVDHFLITSEFETSKRDGDYDSD